MVKRITLVGVQFTLVHMKNGGIRLGSEKDAGDDSLIGRISDVINAHGGQSSSLESFAVRDARLGFYDEITGLQPDGAARQPGAARQGRRHRHQLRCRCDDLGQQQPCHRRSHLPPDKGPITGTLAVTGLDLRGAGRATPNFFDGVKTCPMMASASTNFRVEPAAS